MRIEPIDPDGKTMARASLVRGWSSALRKHGLLEPVTRRLTDEVAQLLQTPPASTEWVDVAYFECVAQAVFEEVGEQKLDALFTEAQRSGWVVLLSRFAGGIARVFGQTPATVLRHAPAAAKANTIGFGLQWVDLGPNRGELIADYPHRRRIHPASAWGTSTACQIAADVVSTRVERARPIVEPLAGGGTRVRAPVQW